MLHQKGNNNKALGGIVGRNNYGMINQCSNSATISYDPTIPKNSDKNISPYIGNIVGDHYGQLNLQWNNGYGQILTGNLQKYDGFLGIGSYNQKKYVGAFREGHVGRETT